MGLSLKKKNICVYKCAIDYLEKITPDSVILDKYYQPSRAEYMSLNDVFVQFIHSAQNYQRMPKVIAFEKRKDDVRDILKGFDIDVVSVMDCDELYKQFRALFNISSKDSKNNSWYKWSRSIVDSAKFLKEFRDVDDFRTFVNRFDYNVHTSMALPLLISEKISGIGFALACDLLKELGFTRYPKPDVHMKEVFHELELCEDDPLACFEAIVRMADFCKEVDDGITPYKVDKIIWLICSGNYYLEEPKIKVSSHKKEFIDIAKTECLR